MLRKYPSSSFTVLESYKYILNFIECLLAYTGTHDFSTYCG